MSTTANNLQTEESTELLLWCDGMKDVTPLNSLEQSTLRDIIRS